MLFLGDDATFPFIETIGAVPASVLAAISTSQQVFLCKNDVPLWGLIKILWIERRAAEIVVRHGNEVRKPLGAHTHLGKVVGHIVATEIVDDAPIRPIGQQRHQKAEISVHSNPN